MNTKYSLDFIVQTFFMNGYLHWFAFYFKNDIFKIKICFLVFRPTTIDNLLKIEEVAVEKAHKYGQEVLTFVREYCKEHKWKTDSMPEAVEITAKVGTYMFLRYFLELWHWFQWNKCLFLSFNIEIWWENYVLVVCMG